MPPKSERADWTEECLSLLIRQAIDVRRRGGGSDNGSFKSSALVEFAAEVNRVHNTTFSETQVRTKLTNLKAEYNIFKRICENSGFGWDPVRMVPTAPDRVWENYIAAHKGAKKYRTRTLPFYEQLEELFAESRATGQYAPTRSAQALALPVPAQANVPENPVITAPVQINSVTNQPTMIQPLSTLALASASSFSVPNPLPNITVSTTSPSTSSAIVASSTPVVTGNTAIQTNSTLNVLSPRPGGGVQRPPRADRNTPARNVALSLDALQQTARTLAMETPGMVVKRAIQTVYDTFQSTGASDEDVMDISVILENFKKANAFLSTPERLRQRWIERRLGMPISFTGSDASPNDEALEISTTNFVDESSIDQPQAEHIFGSELYEQEANAESWELV